ncbi:PHA/PHB synthase family protein [Frigidibacter sp. ROC022]|uniref:PHA/PHB synthase family protein n=1 Tax=Frigidibacter sp. ROC022 TaxID=2971796 RepID=UPI00215AA225|nr:class I poly(R)-hydroxyalkanoic acid synthase [Frigidibacter sp. ROC022]MCR8723055.1 class I poly(R)-hydroxyalkanoic acid synthase [Frigidibacter sp. ROC022]
MATDDAGAEKSLAVLNANLAKVEALTQRLVAAMAHKRQIDPALQAPGQDLYQKAAAAWVAQMMSDPSKMIEQQVNFWSRSVKHYAEAQKALAEGHAPEDPTGPDKRFANEAWQKNPWFNFLKQQYLMSSEAMAQTVQALQGLDDRERKKLSYFSRQLIDMMSPTNFLGTNPEALAKAVETDGQSLVDGLENLVRDVEANAGDVVVTLADKEAFEVGGNLATTPGKVVFRNRMMELIQYAPATEEVHKIPLVIFPPWINKFYILDLKEQNSLIKWITEQGFTLFVVSWVNPDASYRDVGVDDYASEGMLEAIRVASEICGVPKVNVVGYCIAGTTLAMTLAWLEAEKKEKMPVASATFFTTLTDFSDQGEVGVFLDDDFVDGIERECEANGILDSFYMSRTFSFLRSNDLIYQPAIRSYMMGQAPPAFDLLYWNGDSTNLPGRMAVEYLRGLCQADQFSQGGYLLMGRKVRLRDVKVPLFAVACETDHIAAWRASFNGVVQMGSEDKTFVLSESGHIAGIVNPPSKNKYSHWSGGDLDLDPDAWREDSTHTPGSWWPKWGKWLAERSGPMVKPRVPGKGKAKGKYKALADAPGTYVVAVPKSAPGSGGKGEA